jgi:glycosyltransferase involved in cell wall biosynthesis
MAKLQLQHDIVFVSLEPWDEVWRRNQFVCAELAVRFPKRVILFVEPAERGADEKLRPLPEQRNIVCFRPRKSFPNSVRIGRTINQKSFERTLRKALSTAKIEEPLLWINAHDAAHLAGRLGESTLVYDITDDWTLTYLPPHEQQLVAEQDAELCRRADLTIVCSQALLESRQKQSQRILHLPNGVHIEHYQNLEKYSNSAPQWPRPVFGYTGTLHAERVDVELVLALAQEYSSGTVALVGPDALDAATRQKLQSAGNIVLTGAVPCAEIPRYMAAFDVCIVPHQESPFTESLNPLKLWEYLACGKPIASTNVAGFRDYRDLCYIGSGRAGFIEACQNALAEDGNEKFQARQQAVAGQSWSARVDELLLALNDLES